MELNLFSQEPSELSENRKIVETKLRRPKSQGERHRPDKPDNPTLSEIERASLGSIYFAKHDKRGHNQSHKQELPMKKIDAMVVQ